MSHPLGVTVTPPTGLRQVATDLVIEVRNAQKRYLAHLAAGERVVAHNRAVIDAGLAAVQLAAPHVHAWLVMELGYMSDVHFDMRDPSWEHRIDEDLVALQRQRARTAAALAEIPA